MSWDQKKGKKKYYYRSKRVDGKSIKEYVGRGRTATEAELFDQQQHLRKQFDQRYWDLRLCLLDRASDSTDHLFMLSTILFKAILISSGFYLHKGHEWRRRNNYG
ncbi:hypothetical protein [Gimesia sp.]|uniref:hypothetical protein n=1 Tax=Gimesia sp. TaxID=2024833 RepID=UPI003A8DF922